MKKLIFSLPFFVSLDVTSIACGLVVLCVVIYLVMGANNLLSKHEKSKKEITELKARISALLSERVTIGAENKGDQRQSSEELDAAIKNAVA